MNCLTPARDVLKAIRRASFSETQTRLALMILEWGLCRGRTGAPFRKQDDFAVMDGEMNKSQVSRALAALVTANVIESADGVYSFRPPAAWRVRGRAREGRQAAQDQLELRFEELAQQLDLELYELDAELAKRFASGVAESATPVVNLTTSRVAESTTAVVNLTTGATLHIPSLKREVQVQKLKALNARAGEAEFMERVASFLGPDGSANDGGKWRNRFRDLRTRDKCERVFAAAISERKEGKLIYEPGGYVEDLWKRFAE
jgi:hypothetical protein